MLPILYISMDFMSFENMSREDIVSKLREKGYNISKKYTPRKLRSKIDNKGIIKIQTPQGTVKEVFMKTPDPRKTIRRTMSKTSKGGKRKTKKYNKRK